MTSTDHDQPDEGDLRDLSRALFGTEGASEPPPATEPPAGNHVPREGGNPAAASSEHLASLQYARSLFGGEA